MAEEKQQAKYETGEQLRDRLTRFVGGESSAESMHAVLLAEIAVQLAHSNELQAEANDLRAEMLTMVELQAEANKVQAEMLAMAKEQHAFSRDAKAQAEFGVKVNAEAQRLMQQQTGIVGAMPMPPRGRS